MLTKSGAKLLDFGLAKLQEARTSSAGHSQLETRNDPLTAEGVVLGTVQYMAPEQLEGKETDSRTDIFALGTVLYKMATGKKAFTGKSQASLISAILKDEPAPISQIQPMTPPLLDHSTPCAWNSRDNRFLLLNRCGAITTSPALTPFRFRKTACWPIEAAAPKTLNLRGSIGPAIRSLRLVHRGATASPTSLRSPCRNLQSV
jgi:serine/threonine protein kinase